MKRLILLVTSLAFTLCVFGCSSTDNIDDSNNSPTQEEPSEILPDYSNILLKEVNYLGVSFDIDPTWKTTETSKVFRVDVSTSAIFTTCVFNKGQTKDIRVLISSGSMIGENSNNPDDYIIANEWEKNGASYKLYRIERTSTYKMQGNYTYETTDYDAWLLGCTPSGKGFYIVFSDDISEIGSKTRNLPDTLIDAIIDTVEFNPDLVPNPSEISETEIEETLKPTTSQMGAEARASNYLKVSAFSYTGLIKQLEYEGYTHEDAVYGVDHCGADWNAQAAKKAQEYMNISSFSRSSLISQLEYEGFTAEQAAYGASAVGL